jgi:GTP diphosphokinase / guanosine-3',5'-bis(diphosphate) 3'-diphosphatase
MLAMLRVAPRLPSPSLRAAAIRPQVGRGAPPMMRQFELVEQVKSYDPHADEDALNRA